MNDSDFIELCKEGSLQQINDAIENGANVNAEDALFGMTALMMAACKNEDPEVITALLNAGADVMKENNIGERAIDLANENTNLKGTEAYRRLEAAVNAIHDSDFLELCKQGSLQQINDAVNKGANVNVKGEDGATPLMLAARENPDPEVITALIEAGADVNASDNEQVMTPLIGATYNSNPEVITILIKAGANVNARNNKGATALMYAKLANRPEVMAALTNENAMITQKSAEAEPAYKNETPAMNDSDFVELCKEGSLQQINDAIANGANVNAKIIDTGWTALMNAACRNNPEAVTALLNAGADVNAKDQDGTAALMYAVCVNPQTVAALLNAGADVNARNQKGVTALMQAVRNNNPEIISVLLNAGAAPNAKK